MKSSPLISVVVPMYNAEKFIQKCIQHLVHQTYKNLEIIIVDDGSTDNSVALCKRHAKYDKRIQIIQQKNSGPANARNNGMAHATGQYIHFHDSDDYIDLDYYENMVRTINATNADIICGGVDEIGYTFPSFEKIDVLTSLMDKMLITHSYEFNVVWRFLYKREFLQNNKLMFPDEKFIGEDKEFALRAIYYASNVATAPKTIYHCVSVPTSLGKTFKTIMNGRPNGNVKSDQKHDKFMSDSGLTNLIKQLKAGILQYVKNYKILAIPVFAKKYFSNGMIKYYICGIHIATCHKLKHHDKFCIFGIYLYRYHISLD